MISPKTGLPVVAALGVAFAVNFVVQSRRVEPPPAPVVSPPKNPFAAGLAGAGIVEPMGERVTAIGPSTPGLVLEVYATVGAVVTRGTPLLRVDDRALRAEHESRRAARDLARAKLARLEAMPRAEELPPLEARVEEARALARDAETQLERAEKAFKVGQGVISVDELERRRWQASAVKKALARAEAELALAKAGAWAPDVALARAELAQAEAALALTAVEIERATIKAPRDGTVLEVNVSPGEYAAANLPLIVFGDLSSLLVRTDVDEESAPLVRAGCRAYATLRGFPDGPIPLEFVRIEPHVRPKKSLTGDNTERVDTRVLQVIFKLGPTKLPVYAGQQVEVFMEAPAQAPEEIAR